MRGIAFLFGAAALAALAAATFGRFYGDPHAFYGSAIRSWIQLSGSLSLLGILAALLGNTKD